MSDVAVRERRKAVLYVTSGNHLLVFREPAFPEIGLQPPGGTIREDESIEAGAIRELAEETGIIATVEQLHLLGASIYQYERDGVAHRHLRHFFHVPVDADVSRRWTMIEETPDGGDFPIVFELFWLPLTKDIAFFAGLDALLSALRERLQ